MAELDKLVTLLGQTDGRDKIYKFLAGVMKILATLAFRNQDPRAKVYAAIGASIGNARSLMRMAKWVGNIPKLQAITDQVQAKGLQRTELRKYIEFLRVVGDFFYVLGDNVTWLAKHKLVETNAALVAKKARLAQFWGFFFACVLDLFALRAALHKRVIDEVTSKKEAKAAVISFTKDSADVLVAMAAVGYCNSVWNPSSITTGALTALSGGVATYLNWNKIK